MHSFPASILSFAHCRSTDSLITAAFIRSLLQHRFFHCCSIHLLNGALRVTPAEFISMPPASIPAFAHCCSSDCVIAAVSFFSLLQYLFPLCCNINFSHCCNINFLIAAVLIRSFLQHSFDTPSAFICSLTHYYSCSNHTCSMDPVVRSLLQHLFSLLQHHVSHYCSIHSFVHSCSAHQPMPAFIPSIDSLVRSLLQHRFPHSCSIFFSHCCSIKLIIAAAFIRSLLQHAHWCITRYSCSIHFLMPPARSLIAAAASLFSLLKHSFVHCCSIHLLIDALLLTPASFIFRCL